MLSKKQKIIGAVGAGILILLIVVVTIVLMGGNEGPLRTANVSMTAQGFIPGDMTVEKNTKVTWTNADEKAHSVGANPYPTHDSLKELVSKSLKSGETYSYTFKKSGTYHYHDDLNPTINAVIVVK